MGATEAQALTVHSKKKLEKEGGPSSQQQKKVIQNRSFQTFNATLVMRRDTTLKIAPEIEASSTRSQTRKDIMLTLLKMMNQQHRDSEKKELILQVMKNMS